MAPAGFCAPIRRVRKTPARGELGALVAIAGALLVQLAWVPATNFGGLDEWLDLELASRGVVAVPYAYRPLGLVWAVPPALLVPVVGFAAFRWFYALYALLSAMLVFGIVRRLLPERTWLALLTACFSVAWAPGDMARLSTVDGALYQGIAFGTLLAVGFLVEAWHRQSTALFGASVLLAFLAIRCYEGGILFLAFAPALLLASQERSRRFWIWTWVWELVVGCAAAFVLLEMSVSAGQAGYQLSYIGLDPDPLGWAGRLLRQYSLHLAPLVTSAAREMLRPPVVVAVVGAVVGIVIAGRAKSPWNAERRLLAVTATFGLVLGGLGYSLVLWGWRAPTAYRLQFLSGPGIALFLASLVLLAASLIRGRERLAVAVLAALVVARGTGRTIAMQAEWDSITRQPRQMRMLSALVRVVPGVTPHTLLVVLDVGSAWQGAFSFHHAVQYLYERRAAGFVPLRSDTLYMASPAPEGIRFEPWPSVRQAWDAGRTVYGYHEIVVVRHTSMGDVVVLDSWPAELKPLPAGARYAPRDRIASVPPPKRAEILTR